MWPERALSRRRPGKKWRRLLWCGPAWPRIAFGESASAFWRLAAPQSCRLMRTHQRPSLSQREAYAPGAGSGTPAARNAVRESQRWRGVLWPVPPYRVLVDVNTGLGGHDQVAVLYAPRPAKRLGWAEAHGHLRRCADLPDIPTANMGQQAASAFTSAASAASLSP
jgi:hypothetical protein